MIALLTGEIAYKSIGHLIVDVGGVGYRLQIPLSTYYALPDQGAVRLHVHTQVREDAIQLFGFLHPEEKEMFTLLITVSGIGPKLAVNILSHIPASALGAALAESDAKRLATLPGIGKKTAERLILELREKVPRPGTAAPGPGPVGCETAQDSPREDVLSALINLGYKENQAKKVLDGMEIAPGAGLEDILKGALKVLVK